MVVFLCRLLCVGSVVWSVVCIRPQGMMVVFVMSDKVVDEVLDMMDSDK